MKTKKAAALFALALILFSACQFFLGPDPDTSDEGVLRSLWKDFDEIHAYIDIRMSQSNNFNSWHDVLHNEERGYLQRLASGWSLFHACGHMLAELQDPHVILFAPSSISTFVSPMDSDFERDRSEFLSSSPRDYLEDSGFSSDLRFIYGVFSEPFNQIGYLHLASFQTDNLDVDLRQWAREIDSITKYFNENNVRALIIDIRNNQGGLGLAADFIAGRFAAEEKNYMVAMSKNGPRRNDFSPPVIHRIKPEGVAFTKPIALLTNKATISAAEWFTMALRTQSHVTHMGTTTNGAFSQRVTRPMINGWYYSISTERVTDMHGNIHEGIGIIPDIIITGELETGEERENHPDRRLERALEEVQKWLEP